MTDFNQKTHDTDVGSHGGQSRQMMEVFENQEFGSIRLLQEAGKTFFCASDVAKALGYVNPYAAVKRHCRGPLTKREGVVQKVNQYGDAGEQVVEISFITEGDVYRLIVHSKLPSAERFEHWVFDEVLPSIRKHGVYMSDSILDQVIQHPEVIYTLAQELVAEREQLECIRKQLDAAQPKADYFDTFVNSEDCTCIRNFCKEIGIPEKTAVALLLDHRYLYRSPSGWLMPFADKSARGYFIVRDCYGRSGKLVQQTRVTCKGKNHLFNGYLVSWCVGHLVELSQPEAYDEKYAKWMYDDLPILPDHWRYQVSASTKKQFGILKKLMQRKDVESLICATDAGREGELIFRLVYHQCGCKKPVERLWISSMEDSAIREGFQKLRPGTEYDGTAVRACRGCFDNLSSGGIRWIFSL